MFNILKNIFWKKPELQSQPQPALTEQQIIENIARLEKDITALEYYVKPKTILQKIIQGVIVATAVAVGGSLGFWLGSALVVNAVLGLSILITALGAAGLGYGVYSVNKRQDASYKKQTILKINEKLKELNQAKISLFELAVSIESFIFNRESIIQPSFAMGIHPNDRGFQPDSNEKEIQFIRLTEDLRNKLGHVLASRLKSEKAGKKNLLKVKKIDISNAGLSANYFDTLLDCGLGKFKTEHLYLRQNKHGNDIIEVLKEYIVDDKEGVQDLKILDLSGNCLDANCLEDIHAIMMHTKMEELNLADNPALEKCGAAKRFSAAEFSALINRRAAARTNSEQTPPSTTPGGNEFENPRRGVFNMAPGENYCRVAKKQGAITENREQKRVCCP